MSTGEPYPPEVRQLDIDGRRMILVGTAHVSRSSVDLVRRVIENEEPDCVCVELDEQRYEALSKRKQWESLDLKQVIRRKQLPTLLLNVVLAAYQKRLGGELGVQPGSELLEAVRLAEARGRRDRAVRPRRARDPQTRSPCDVVLSPDLPDLGAAGGDVRRPEDLRGGARRA